MGGKTKTKKQQPDKCVMTMHKKELAARLWLYLAEKDELDSWLHPAVPAALPKFGRGAGHWRHNKSMYANWAESEACARFVGTTVHRLAVMGQLCCQGFDAICNSVLI